MDVEHLRWFVAVAAREHVTDAAAELHVTQPALSRALRRLEVEVGVALFDRRGRSVRLNRHGAAFRVRVEQALAELDQARHELTEGTSPDKGTVALAFGATFGTWRVPELLSAYRTLWPQVGFHLREGRAPEMRAWLLNGDVDLIMTSTQTSGRHLLWKPLTRERLALAVAPQHALAQRDSVRLRDIADEPFIALKPGFGLRALGDDLCRHAGFTPQIAFESEDPATVRSLVATGLGVALVPAHDRNHASAPTPIRYLHVRDRDAARTIGIAWLTNRYQPPAAEQFRQFALNYWT